MPISSSNSSGGSLDRVTFHRAVEALHNAPVPQPRPQTMTISVDAERNLREHWAQMNVEMQGRVDYGFISTGVNVERTTMDNNGFGVSDSSIRKYLTAEKNYIKRFMATGTFEQDSLYLTIDGAERLTIWGQEFGVGNLICTLDQNHLYVSTKRGTHLISLLEKLAAREGYEIEITDSVSVDSDTLVGVAYWNFNNREEIDDTELVSVTKANVGSSGQLRPEQFAHGLTFQASSDILF